MLEIQTLRSKNFGLKQSEWLASEDGLAPRKDRHRLSPGKRLK